MRNVPDDTYQALPCFSKQSKRLLIITAEKAEDLEFFYPYYRFIEEGFDVDVATPKGGAFKGKRGLGLQKSLRIADVQADDYDLLYIPGGSAATRLAEDQTVLELVSAFVKAEKRIVSVCEGPQVLAAAGVIEMRKITAWPDVQEDIEAAGAVFVDEKSVSDGPFVTARWPADLPALMACTMKILRNKEADHLRSAA